MKRVRLIALDMDGTLLLSDHCTIPQENINAIKRADSAGIRVCISTGRMLEDASDFVNRYDLPCMISSSNGARASDAPLPHGRILFRENMAPADLHAALDMLLPYGMMINAFEDGQVSTIKGKSGRDYHLVDRGLIKARYGERAVREAADRGVMKLFAVWDGNAGEFDAARMTAIRKELIQKLPTLEISSSGQDNIEIVSARAGKGAALHALAVHLGLNRENVMAVGDAPNDLSMLRYAYHSTAMGNASREIQEMCRYVTATNDEFGVAKIIDRVLEAKR